MMKKIQNIIAFVEFLAGAGLAIFFHLVLHYEQAAYIIFGIGILLSLGTYLVREDIEKTRDTLLEEYHKAHETTFMLSQITDAECQAKAQEVMASAKRTLSLLKHGRIPLDENEFYLEAAKCCDQALHDIKAIDPLNQGWTSRAALLNLVQANARALERGVKITRVFVVDREELLGAEGQNVLLGQFQDGIEVRIVYRDEIPAAKGDMVSWENNSSFDLTIYDDKVMMGLVMSGTKYFGTKTREATHMEKYLRLFDLINNAAHGAVEQDGAVIPAIGYRLQEVSDRTAELV
ncbi:MAG TPA: hypothetical protein VGJ94_02780 [Syntrophorhabdaceae bacterium]|jgi:hypothetical protein